MKDQVRLKKYAGGAGAIAFTLILAMRWLPDYRVALFIPAIFFLLASIIMFMFSDGGAW